jgi:hypothetical protein
MPFFPWVFVWICLPLSGAALLFFSPIDKDRSKKVGCWCMGWFLAFSLYLLFFRSRIDEYYSFLDLHLKTDPQTLWAGIGSLVLISFCMVSEKRVALGLTFLALMALCLVVQQWIWFWIALECLFVLNIIFFGLSIRAHKVLIDNFWRHLGFVFFMSFFVYHFYQETGTLQNSAMVTSDSFVFLALGLLCYTPVWPFFNLGHSFFLKSKLLGKMMGGVFCWLVFFSALRGHTIPKEVYGMVVGLTIIGLAMTYCQKYDMTHFLPQFVLITGPLYFCVFLHHSFDNLILVMINAAVVMIVCSKTTELSEQESFSLYVALAWTMIQPFVFLWKESTAWENTVFMALVCWGGFRFYKSVPKGCVLWVRDQWTIGLIVWNITFPFFYDLLS